MMQSFAKRDFTPVSIRLMYLATTTQQIADTVRSKWMMYQTKDKAIRKYARRKSNLELKLELLAL